MIQTPALMSIAFADEAPNDALRIILYAKGNGPPPGYDPAPGFPIDGPWPALFAKERIVLLWAVEADLTRQNVRELGGAIAAYALAHQLEAIALCSHDANAAAADFAADLAYGATLRAFACKGYRTGVDTPRTPRVTIVSPVHDEAHALFEPLRARAEGICIARQLVWEPPNLLTPQSFASRLVALERLGVAVRILETRELAQIGMGALLAVARGSAAPPVVAMMTWRGADASQAPLVLVGKGVTFDSGGLNAKPAAFMFKMKTDMGGAAAVVGAMHAIASRRAPRNVVGLIGLVENMPGPDAYRPSDVLTTYSGKTVEIIDTDNEGRLVLCDLLSFAERELRAGAIVDIATLTGGARMALGAIYAPLCANDDTLGAQLTDLGAREGERLWRLPCGAEYDSMIASPIADMANGRTDIAAHAIVAARFLARFVEQTPWAHIDMAAFCVADADAPLCPAGPTGFGVALFDALADADPQALYARGANTASATSKTQVRRRSSSAIG